MKKEDVTLLAQLLSGMDEAVERLSKAQKKKDLEEVASIKREIINFQKQIEALL
jgi:hypothetical protein